MTDQTTIENLDIDGVTYIVDEQPEEIQRAVRKYEEWRERFALAQDEVNLVGAALRDLGSQLVGAIKANEAQAAAAEAQAADNSDLEITGEVVNDTPVGETLVVDDA